MSLADRAQTVPTRLVSALFFLSGMTGLSYEVIWFKEFSHIWGSSTFAMATVVGAFLAGLGIGAHVTGPIADRVTKPVLWYGLCEIGIGLLALMIPMEMNLLSWLSSRCYTGLYDYSVGYPLVRLATTFVAIGPPCALMGATLPLLVSQLTIRGNENTSATGWLYGINTLGAALGCYLVGFHLLPEFGLFLTNIMTAAANLLIGFVALVFALRSAPRAAFDRLGEHVMADIEPPANPVSVSSLPITVIYTAAMLTGVASLILQTVWSRQLALVLGSSTYAFSAMLFVVLTGIGVGSLLYEAVKAKFVDDGMILIALSTGGAVAVVAGIWLIPFAADYVGASKPLRSDYTVNSIVCVVASAAVELLPAIVMGMLFPALVRASTTSAAMIGTSVGKLYVWNTLGTLTGSLVTSLWIVPNLGTHAALVVALHLYLGIAATLVVSGRFNAYACGAVALAAVSVAAFIGNPVNPLRINRGLFYYGYHDFGDDLSQVVYFKEGIACNVMVTRHGEHVSFRVNGKVDGSSKGDMSMQAGLAYLPRFMNPDARSVLVIGFGTGTTSGSSLLFPDTTVTCCEIEPAVVAASRFFSAVNHRPEESSRFQLVYDDARAYVQGTTQKFDLILSEPSNPWIAGISNLFTSEFYSIASRKLNPGGVFAQWIQTYAFTPEDYSMVVQTMSDVFPHQRLIRVSDVDTILLASNDPIEFSPEVIRTSQRLVDESATIKADLKRYFSTPVVSELLLTRILMDECGLQQFVAANGNNRRNLDGDLQLEFRAARHIFERHSIDTGVALLGFVDPGWVIEQFECLSESALHTNALSEVVTLLTEAGHQRIAAKLAEAGCRKNPNSAQLIASQLILSEYLDMELLGQLLATPDDSVLFQANRVGVAFWNRKKYDDAVKVLQETVNRFPDSATSWTNLALNHEHLGQLELAETEYRRALKLDPANSFTVRESRRMQLNYEGARDTGNDQISRQVE